MSENGDSGAPGITARLRRVVLTGASALHNRGELFLVELQQETNRVLELFIWASMACLLGIGSLALLTATVIFLFPVELRAYAAGGFAVLYLAAALFAWINLRALLKVSPPPFSGTIDELKKDREWFESLE